MSFARTVSRLRVLSPLGPPVDPGWYATALEALRRNVSDPDFPCHFGRQAYTSGVLHVAPAADAAELADVLDLFCRGQRDLSPERLSRRMLATIVPPQVPRPDHDEHRRVFWRLLQDVHDLDRHPWPDDVPEDPQHPRWEFSFGGVPMFVFGAAPSHRLRRSRDLGPGMVLLFQPRSVFEGIAGGTASGEAARRVVRRRMAAWDLVPPHPAMGDYGDPSNHEWAQYFLPDDDVPVTGTCPLRVHGRSAAAIEEPAMTSTTGTAPTARTAPTGRATPAATVLPPTRRTGAAPARTASDGEAPQDQLLHELLRPAALRDPEAVAVVCGGRRRTYGELEATANRLAHHLVDIGVGTGDIVAVLAGRHVETVTAMLAVLKAGAAYLPVDPQDAPRRLEEILDLACVQVVVGADGTLGALEAVRSHREVEVIVPDVDPDWLEVYPSTPPAVDVRPHDPAYVIFTSGSTGSPKGVVVEHRQIAHAALAQLSYPRPAPGRFLLLPPLFFDASADGLYWTWLEGGTVVIPEEGRQRDPLHLRELVADHGITHSDCTPTLYSLLLGEDAQGLGSLRCVKVGGEACPTELVARHARLLPDTWLVNNYGPTEATVWSACWTWQPGDVVPDPVPIGRPIPGTRIHLLDDGLVPVRDGEPGQVCIGGPGVARGYLARPDLTAERFVPEPGHPGQRIYLSGDRAVRRPNGQLVFLGRQDDQVKVRGFRIEPAEITRALAAHPDVVDAAVAVRQVHAGTDDLVGYVVVRPGTAPSEEQIRVYVRRWVPEHMVPRWVVRLDELPTTRSHKVDVAALPLPRSAAVTAGTPPATDMERSVAAIAGALLGRDDLCREDDVVALGMTSVHIAQLAMAILQQHQVVVGVHTLFDRPTVSGIAATAETEMRHASEPGKSPWDLDRLERECRLDRRVQPRGDGDPARWADPRVVLLTGGTGYLGTFLLRQLLEDTDARVVTLVRAPDATAATERVRASMLRWGVLDESLMRRVEAVPGDLAEAGLGLSPATWTRLSREVDAIFHVGALVNFLYPYSRLVAANVTGTMELLQLACAERDKAFHYVSSIDNLLTTGVGRPFYEDVPVVPTEVPVGYPLSKYVAEMLVQQALDRGLPGTVHRTGMVMGHTGSGATASDYLVIQIAALVGFGIAPHTEALLDAVPVDFAVRCISQASRLATSDGKTFHIWSGRPVHYDQVFEWARTYGYRLSPANEDEVIGRFRTLPPENPLFPLLPLYADPKWRDVRDAFKPEMQHLFDVDGERKNLLEALQGSGIEDRGLGEAEVHRMFDFLVADGVLESPAVQVARLSTEDGAS